MVIDMKQSARRSSRVVHSSSVDAHIPTIRILIGLFIISTTLITLLLVRDWNRNVVVSVPDGDSIDLSDGRRVRLLGLDAPEKGLCMSQNAQVRLSELTLGYHVRLKDTVKDDYGRILANVIVDQPLTTWLDYLNHRFIQRDNISGTAMVSRVLVEEGLARFSSVDSEYKKLLSNAQTSAKEQKLGIWGPICRQDVPANSRCTVKGNIRAGLKAYYLPACRYYDQVIVDTSFGDTWFCSELEAKNAGFTLTLSCYK